MTRVKLNINDCKIHAINKNGICLSDTYTNNKTLMLWQCNKCLYKWENSFGHIRNRNQWCPKCARQVRTLQDCIDKAIINNGECISDKYINLETKLKWKCNVGHIWEATPHSILLTGRWCPDCGGSKRKTIQDCHDLALKMNGKFLSLVYINSSTKYDWVCKNSHTFSANYDNVNYGYWCPKCKRSKAQTILTDNIEKIFNIKSKCNVKTFKWLKDNSLLEIDIWIPELKLAIEYDGEQHFIPLKFSQMSDKQAKDNLIKTQKRDELKNILIKNHPEDIRYFIRFKYDENINNIEYVKDKLKKYGVLSG